MSKDTRPSETGELLGIMQGGTLQPANELLLRRLASLRQPFTLVLLSGDKPTPVEGVRLEGPNSETDTFDATLPGGSRLLLSCLDEGLCTYSLYLPVRLQSRRA